MTAANKVNSNLTGLAYAEEASPKTLPGTAIWVPLEPNGYKEFGGTLATKVRNPINAGRQFRKSVITDLNAAGGFDVDLTQEGQQDLLQGFFFASLRKKGEAKNALGVVTMTIAVTKSGSKFTVGGTGGPADLQTVFVAGDIILTAGFTNAANNGIFKVATTAAAYVTVTKADGANTAAVLVDESAVATASIVRVGFETAVGDLDVSTAGSLPVLTSTILDFTTLGLAVGEFIYVGGDLTATKFGTTGNNGFARVRSVVTHTITLDKTQSTMTTEANTTLLVQVFFGRVLMNETGSSIVQRSYNLERTLGKADSGDTYDQVEYLTGAVPNDLGINVKAADKVTLDLAFVAMDTEVLAGSAGPKTGTRVTMPKETAFNTTSDFSRIKLAVQDETNAAPTPLFAFCQDITLTINNGVTPDKAVGVLGAFNTSIGSFKVSGKLTAYFTAVASVTAIRANANVTLDICMVKNNKGIVIDLPMLTLGDGRMTVVQDKPVTMAITSEASSGADIVSTMDHTLLMSFFDYLPSAADL